MTLRRFSVLVMLLAACTGSGGASVASPSPSPSSAASSSPPPSPSPSATPGSTALKCVHPVTVPHGLVLFELATVSPPTLEVVDVTNPARPVLDCTLSPAQGGQFAGSTTVVRYVYAGHLGTVDLASGVVTETGQLPVPAVGGTFSADGSKFAYRFFDDTAGMTAHIFSKGQD